MTRDPKKLKEYRPRYKKKLKRLGINRLDVKIIRKCHKCGLEVLKTDVIHIIKGKRRKLYHQECWNSMQH